MRTADYPEVPPDFGHWLAGFIDGEGCFMIARNNHVVGYRVYFAMNLRDDDTPILERCIETTGLGHLTYRPRKRNAARPGEHAQMEWHVVRKRDCARLVELLDRFPLRAKKAADYAVWRQAVSLHAEIRNGRPPKGMAPSSWEPIGRLREELVAARAYEHPTTPRSGRSG